MVVSKHEFLNRFFSILLLVNIFSSNLSATGWLLWRSQKTEPVVIEKYIVDARIHQFSQLKNKIYDNFLNKPIDETFLKENLDINKALYFVYTDPESTDVNFLLKKKLSIGFILLSILEKCIVNKNEEVIQQFTKNLNDVLQTIKKNLLDKSDSGLMADDNKLKIVKLDDQSSISEKKDHSDRQIADKTSWKIDNSLTLIKFLQDLVHRNKTGLGDNNLSKNIANFTPFYNLINSYQSPLATFLLEEKRNFSLENLLLFKNLLKFSDIIKPSISEISEIQKESNSILNALSKLQNMDDRYWPQFIELQQTFVYFSIKKINLIQASVGDDTINILNDEFTKSRRDILNALHFVYSDNQSQDQNILLQKQMAIYYILFFLLKECLEGTKLITKKLRQDLNTILAVLKSQLIEPAKNSIIFKDGWFLTEGKTEQEEFGEQTTTSLKYKTRYFSQSKTTKIADQSILTKFLEDLTNSNSSNFDNISTQINTSIKTNFTSLASTLSHGENNLVTLNFFHDLISYFDKEKIQTLNAKSKSLLHQFTKIKLSLPNDFWLDLAKFKNNVAIAGLAKFEQDQKTSRVLEAEKQESELRRNRTQDKRRLNKELDIWKEDDENPLKDIFVEEKTIQAPKSTSQPDQNKTETAIAIIQEKLIGQGSNLPQEQQEMLKAFLESIKKQPSRPITIKSSPQSTTKAPLTFKQPAQPRKANSQPARLWRPQYPMSNSTKKRSWPPTSQPNSRKNRQINTSQFPFGRY